MMDFYDIEPEPKSTEELYLLIMEEVKGKKVNMKKYIRSEILEAQKHLIKNGYLSGGVDWDEVWFTSVLPKGEFYMERLRKILKEKS